MGDSRVHSEQPMPVRNGHVSIQSIVRADLEARERVGVDRYGTPLQPHNGRDALRDAYEEALDLACYLRQAIYERDSDPVEPDVAASPDVVPEVRWMGIPPSLYLPEVCENLGIDPTGLSEEDVLEQIRKRSGWALPYLSAASERMSAATEQMLEEPPRGTGGPVSTG